MTNSDIIHRMNEGVISTSEKDFSNSFAELQWNEFSRRLVVQSLGPKIFSGCRIANQDLPQNWVKDKYTLNAGSYASGISNRISGIVAEGKMTDQKNASNYRVGDIVVLEAVVPMRAWGSIEYIDSYTHSKASKGDQCYLRLKVVFAGIIDNVDSAKNFIVLKRGICVIPRELKPKQPDNKSSIIYNDPSHSDDPLKIYSKGLPLSMIEGATKLEADSPAAAFFERQLYSELITIVNQTEGLHVVATDLNLIEIADLEGLSRTQQILEQELNGGIDSMGAERERMIKEQIAQLQTEIESLPNDIEADKYRARFNLDLVLSLKEGAKRVLEVKLETDEKKLKINDIVTKFGFKPELINPFFYLYVRDIISMLVNMAGPDRLPQEYSKEEIIDVMNLSVDEVLSIFPQLHYGETISPQQAVFFEGVYDRGKRVVDMSAGLESILSILGDNQSIRDKALIGMKRIYSRHFHPDVTHADPKLADKMYRAGYQIFTDFGKSK